MYDITFASILRNATPYLERYMALLHGALDHFRRGRIVWVEGDSDDGTYQRLQELSGEFTRQNHEVTLIKLDHGGPKYGSVDETDRWWRLEMVWNRALAAIQDTEWAVLVESDLVWDYDTLAECMQHVESGVADVVYPMLYSASIPMHFHDSNGFRLLDGTRFTNRPPFVPGGWRGERFVPIQTGGGLIVTRGSTLDGATWRDKCRLHFREGIKLVADTQLGIYHP